jgi:hypothetical protein
MVAARRGDASTDLGIFNQFFRDCLLVNFHQNVCMRISDDRYSRERARMELALRFLRHEARTHTIRAWTGLSDDRIRKLFRSYVSQARRHLPRHRGKSPHQVAYFTRSLRLQEETAVLASVLSLLGVVSTAAARGAGTPLPGITRGELLCQAFEAFRLFLPAAQISFEHAVFLTSALDRGDQLRLGDCAGCGTLIVTERFPLRAARCARCAAPGTRRTTSADHPGTLRSL